VPQPLPGETPTSSQKRLAEETLSPIFKNLKTHMQSLHNTLEDLGASVSPFPTFLNLLVQAHMFL